MEKTRVDWNGLHLGKFEKCPPTFFQIYSMSVYTCIKMSFTQLENNSRLLCGHDFANERLLPIWHLELIISKIKQTCLKWRDLTPLRIVRPPVAIDRELKQYSADQVNNQCLHRFAVSRQHDRCLHAASSDNKSSHCGTIWKGFLGFENMNCSFRSEKLQSSASGCGSVVFLPLLVWNQDGWEKELEVSKSAY